MFQGMFRKRGRPPDPLPIGGYDEPSNEESSQIPVHQLLEAPRQLPLPSVREFEQIAIMQQERSGLNNAVSDSSSSQLLQQDVNMSDSQDRRLAINPEHLGCALLGLEISGAWQICHARKVDKCTAVNSSPIP